jgi:hypothetical protein
MGVSYLVKGDAQRETRPHIGAHLGEGGGSRAGRVRATMVAEGMVARQLLWTLSRCNGVISTMFFLLSQTIIGDTPRGTSPISFKCKTQQRRHELCSYWMRLWAHLL